MRSKSKKKTRTQANIAAFCVRGAACACDDRFVECADLSLRRAARGCKLLASSTENNRLPRLRSLARVSCRRSAGSGSTESRSLRLFRKFVHYPSKKARIKSATLKIGSLERLKSAVLLEIIVSAADAKRLIKILGCRRAKF